jgi:hypothetical protein
MEELSYLVQELKKNLISIIFTGLHQKLLVEMKNGSYFAELMDK